jgi:Flp pilus assembly pilin Flp
MNSKYMKLFKGVFMLNLIKNFIADERGAESTELAVTTLVVAGGAVSGYTSLKSKIGEKQDDLLGKLDESSAD